MKDFKTPLKQDDDIYGQSALRKRLNGNTIPMKQETNRSMSSLKDFRPEKMNLLSSTARSNKI